MSSTTPKSRSAPTLLFVGTQRGGGGIESYFVTLATALADAGFDVHAAVWPGDVMHRALAADPRVTLHALAFRKRNDLRATRALVAIARAVRPGWLIGMYVREYWPLAAVARLLRVQLLLFEHVERRMHPVMRRFLPRFFERLVAPSEFLRAHLVASGIPAAQTAVLHNPIDLARFRPPTALERAAARAALGFAPDDVVVGFVGRVESRKGAPVLLDALDLVMAERATVRALWVGDGELAGELQARTERATHAGRHRWLPFTDDVRPLLAAMDLLALPSVGKETFGRVLVEAQATGLPVVGARTGGIPEALVDGETGVVVPPGDAPALAAALRRLVDDRATRARMGAAGVTFARAFDVRLLAPRLARALRDGLDALDDGA